jgi:hypothetical protein
MIIRALDISHDWTFGKGGENYLSGQLGIAENVQTRILSFLNNCFFDMGAGIDWFTYLGVPNKSQEIILRTRAVILQSYGVVSVNSINLSQPNVNRRNAILTYSINTIYTQNYTETLQVVNYA